MNTYQQNQDTKLARCSQALTKPSKKFCSSISKLNHKIKGTPEITVSIEELLIEIEETTQGLMENLSEFKKEYPTH
jgi:hypothetical protein